MKNISELILEARRKNLEADLAVELWLGYLLQISKEELFVNRSKAVDKSVEKKFWEGIDLLSAGMPLAQLTGHKEFYGLDFVVNNQVLIPRPETELVVDLARDFIAKELSTAEQVKVLDVGTGSGNIILALAKTEPKVKGLGVDVSVQALKMAEKNRAGLNLDDRVELKANDLMENIDQHFDIILANLPYIGTEKFNFVARNVADYEPSVALYGGSDGLQLYKKLFLQIELLNYRPKLIIGEFGFGQNAEMEKLLKEFFNDWNFEIIPDLAGIPRVFVIKSAANP